MKHLILILTAPVLLLTSCVTVYFTEPQPYKGEQLTSIPEELQGSWSVEQESWTIDARGLTSAIVQNDNEGNPSDTTVEATFLSDSILLYQLESDYVFNFLDKGFWQVCVFRKLDNGDIAIYVPLNYPYAGKGSGLKVDSVIVQKISIDESDISTSESITRRSFKAKKDESIDKIYYSGQMRKKHLKKMMTEENIVWILSHDGKLYHPADKEE